MHRAFGSWADSGSLMVRPRRSAGRGRAATATVAAAPGFVAQAGRWSSGSGASGAFGISPRKRTSPPTSYFSIRPVHYILGSSPAEP